jgi:hypothetical protein
MAVADARQTAAFDGLVVTPALERLDAAASDTTSANSGAL